MGAVGAFNQAEHFAQSSALHDDWPRQQTQLRHQEPEPKSR